MAQGRFKEFDYNNKKVVFDAIAFREVFDERCQVKKIKIWQFYEQLAQKLNVSDETIKSWRLGKFAPSDINLILELAAAMSVDPERILKEKETMEVRNQVTQEQRASIIKMYQEQFELFNELACMDSADDASKLLAEMYDYYFDEDRAEVLRNRLFDYFHYPKTSRYEEIDNLYTEDINPEDEELLSQVQEFGEKMEAFDSQLKALKRKYVNRVQQLQYDLRLMLLEIPDWVYDFFDDKLNEMEEAVGAYFDFYICDEVEICLDFCRSFDGEEFYFVPMENLEAVYYDFYNGCKDEIKPAMM